MPPPRPDTVRLLRGDDLPTSRRTRRPGVDVVLTVLTPGEAAVQPSADSVEVPRGAAFRAVPLLAFLPRTSGAATVPPSRTPLLAGDAGAAPGSHEWYLAVGQTRTSVGAGAPRVEVHVEDLWLVTAAPPQEPGGVASVRIRRLDPAAHEHPSDNLLFALLVRSLARIGHVVPPGPPEAVATHLAKGLAEQSRNAVQDLRALRYAMERTLGASLRSSESGELDVVLGHVVELSLVASRALDQARDAARSVGWSWRSDEAAFHAYRRDSDPRLPVRDGDAQARGRDWYPTFVAGARQVESMQLQLAEEVPVLHSVLDASATVAVARDAKAQESFNLVAAVGGIAIGLPALVLALYGLERNLPLRPSSRAALLVFPLLLAAVAAVAVAYWLSPRQVRWRRAFVAGAGSLLMIGILVLAGALQSTSSGGQCGDSRPVKGYTADGDRLYVLPGQSAYERAEALDCFATVDDAARSGYRPPG